VLTQSRGIFSSHFFLFNSLTLFRAGSTLSSS
jgi:hypothetical protein